MAATTDTRVRLGRSELDVSPIAFGTWQLSGQWGSFDKQEALDAIRHARSIGINFFDTAQAYGFGASERLLAEALADDLEHHRDELVIATKGGLRLDGDGVLRDSSPDFLRAGVEQSLQALGLDHIDLYQVHWPDKDVPFTETAGVLTDMVSEGKVRHVGVSNFDSEQMAELSQSILVETLQPPYHLFARGIERSVLPWCHEQDVGVLVYGPLAHGLLSGAIDSDTEFAADDWRSGSPDFRGQTLAANLAATSRLTELAGELGVSVSQLAIAWTLAHPAVGVAIIGSTNAKHIEESLGALEIDLDESTLQRIDELMDGAVAVEGPSPEM